MQSVSLLLLTLIAVLAININAQQKTEIKATTEAPAIIEKRTLLTGLMTASDYQKIAVQLAKSGYFPAIKRQPANLSANAGYGFNLNFGNLNRSWIVDGDETNGYTLYADLNGNGDLTDDTPLKFQATNGKHFLNYQTTVTEGTESYPFLIKLELTSDTERGQSSAKMSLAFYNRTTRRGKANLGNAQEISFELIGKNGIYGTRDNYVIFDLNSDGRFDNETEESVEKYSSLEKYVNLAGATYEYEVDYYGRSLTLRRLAEKLPDRESLLAGNIAPDFSFVDTSGKQRRLSDYRGKIVLLDFWASWCEACRIEAPKLVAAHERLRNKNFEIIGINKDSVEVDFRNFIAQYKMSWTQTRDMSVDETQRLYRVTAFPVYYLIDKEGRIILNSTTSKYSMSEIEKYLESN